MANEDPSLIFLGCVTCLLYIVLARFAHLCLVGRDEQALKMQQLLRRGAGGAGGSANKRVLGATAGISSSLGLGSVNQSLASMPRSPNRRSGNATPTPDNSRRSFRERDGTISSAPGSESGDDEGFFFDDDEVGQSCWAQLTTTRTLMFQDVRCWFFILVVIFSLCNAIGALVGLVLTSGEKKLGHNTRRDQDLIFSFPVLSIYVVLVYLLLTLLYLADKEVAQKETQGARTRGLAAFSILVLVWSVAFALVWTSTVPSALEWVSCSIELALSALYFAAAVLLPRRILDYGEGTRGVAIRIRNVCLVVGTCLFARGVVLLPPTQDELGPLGDYPLPVLDCLSMVPVLASLLLLHQRA
jgi:hypothetical protein